MDETVEIDNRPTPDDFDAYLPWACNQVTLPGTVIIMRVFQNEYITEKNTRTKTKPKQSREGLSSDLVKEYKSVRTLKPIEEHLPFEKLTLIKTTYDHNENLIQIKFDKCRMIPCGIFKILTLIMQFHIYCTNITINRGIDNNSLKEMVKVVSTSNVTDLCLDDTIIVNAHYHILLEHPNKLRYLSLRRCRITDEQVEKIAETITYPEPSSTSLTILNLASNRITDVGAKHIAVALRTNRQLSYLNISDNRITDEGAIPIFSCLCEFLITTKELKKSRERMTDYLLKKNKLVSQFFMESKCEGDVDMKSIKNSYRKSKLKKNEKEMSKSNIDFRPNSKETFTYEKFKAMAEAIVGEFYDPFSPKETFFNNCQVYSTGNNKLCYLNIAYNNLTVLSLKELLKVLIYQTSDEQQGKGLVNLNLDGNYLPKTCIEMVRINDILQSGMNMMRGIAAKRKLTRNIKLPK